MPTIPAGVQPIDLSPLALAVARLSDRFLGTNLSAVRFGPGKPLVPTTDDVDRAAGPRQFQYPTAVNQIVAPRRDYPGLTPFEQLRSLASMYDVAALCVATRIEELQGLRWQVVARNHKAQAAEQGACDAVAAFFAKPDQVNDYSSWLGMLLNDLFTIDALTIYPRPARGGGLWGLEVVDGATIKPLVDTRGQVAAYQQILYGYPWSNYERSADVDDDGFAEFSAQDLIYRPRWTRTHTPYGFPPSEWIILRVNMALRKQSFDLSWFTDGNIPEGLIAPPDGLMTPQQVADFENWFNATLQGDAQARRRLKFLPWRADYKPLREFQYNTAIDEWMMRLTCAAFGVPPQELGFTNDVNKSSADLQQNVTYRRGLGPLTVWLKGLFDGFIQQPQFLGQPQLEWTWDFGESEDRKMLAETDKVYYAAGAIDSDELRRLRYPELDGPAPGSRQAQATQQVDQPGQAEPEQLEPFRVGDVEAGIVTRNEARQRLQLAPEGDDQADAARRQLLAMLGLVEAATRAGYDLADAARMAGAPPPQRGPAPATPVPQHPAQKRAADHIAKGHSGVMIALMIPAALAQHLAEVTATQVGAATEPASDLHITLCYLGEASDLGEWRGAVSEVVAEIAAQCAGPMVGQINGAGRFFGTEGEGGDAYYACPDLPGLPALRQRLVALLHDAGVPATENHGYIPHITLAYLAPEQPTPAQRLAGLPLEIGALTLCWGDVREVYPLGPADLGLLAKAAGEGDSGRPPDWRERLERERAAQAVFRAAYSSQLDRLLAVIRRALSTGEVLAPIVAAFLDSDLGQLVAAVLPFYRSLTQAGAEAGAAALSVAVDLELVNAAALELAQAEAARWAQQVTETSRTRALAIIADWIERPGRTLDQLIEQVSTVWTGPRPDVFATTEVTRVYAAANRAAWQASGVVEALEWRTANDELVCKVCGSKHKTRRPMDSTDIPPAHPMCRCWIVPVVVAPEYL